MNTTTADHGPPVRDLGSAEEKLAHCVGELRRVVVAFSGGVDSSLLMVSARRVLGRGSVLAITAESPSLARGELERCRVLASHFDVEWEAVPTDEFSDPRYVRNDGDRCYWCKSALMDVCEPRALASGSTIVLGVNVDDLDDHRPGQSAAAERGARFPFVDAGLNKHDIRSLARKLAIPVWNRPASPCLSSRVPYGTEVTVPLIRRVDRAEAVIRALGFSDLRVRHYGERARVEITSEELTRAQSMATTIRDSLAAVGYHEVEIDAAGLRSGNLNDAL